MSSRVQRKSVFLIALGVFFIILSFVPLYGILPATSYWESRPIVTGSNGIYQDLGFFVSGTYAKLEVDPSGGDSLIAVQVVNGKFDNITRQVIFNISGIIAFDIPKNDYYNLILMNTQRYYYNGNSYVENVNDVLIKVYYYFYNLIFLVLGIVVLLLGLILISYHALSSRTTIAQPPEKNQK